MTLVTPAEPMATSWVSSMYFCPQLLSGPKGSLFQYGLHCVPPRFMCWSPTPSTWECDLIWRGGVSTETVKLKNEVFRMGSDPI